MDLLIAHRGRRVVVAARASPPFVPQALVLEEDTFMVLSADAELREPKAHPLQIFTALLDLEPKAIGEAVECGGAPSKVLAIVHDTALEPTTSLEFVRVAMDSVAELSTRRGWSRLGVEVLGTIHGKLGLDEVLPRILEALPDNVTDVWLIPREGQEDLVGAWLRRP